MKTLWTYTWAYLFVVLEKLDRLSDWIAYQVDNNDYLAGAVGALALMAIPYILGIVDIVVRG